MQWGNEVWDVSGLFEIGVWWRQRLLSFTSSRLVLSQTHQGPGVPRAVFLFAASLCIPMAADSFVVCAAGMFLHHLGLPHFGVAYIPVRRQLPSVFGVRQAPTMLRSVQVNKTYPVSFKDPAGVMLQKSNTLLQPGSSRSQWQYITCPVGDARRWPVELRLLTLKTSQSFWGDGFSIRLRTQGYYLLYSSGPEMPPSPAA